MSFKRLLLLICVLIVLGTVLTGCEGKRDKNVEESWAYIHEPENPVLVFKKDGSASYLNKTYTKYELAENVIRFTAEDGTVIERDYYDNGDTRYVFEPISYEYTTGDDNTQLIGVWENANGNSYQFTAKGTFLEDGIFPGHYILGENGAIKLVYNDPFQDTTLYYVIKDGILTINYPWPMTKSKK